MLPVKRFGNVALVIVGSFGREERHADELFFRKRISKPKINAELASIQSNKLDKHTDKENRKVTVNM